MANPMLDTLSSFVPNLLLQRTLEDPQPIHKPTAYRVQACVFFADISGFTAITEQLVEQGPEGVEILTDLLNDYFGQLIDLINSNGGDVFKFAGDALTALWTVGGETVSLSDAAHRAASTALQVQKALRNYKTPQGHILSLKIGLGTGDIFSTHIGGQLKRWEYFLTGQPMEQAGLAESIARPGEVILSPPAWEHIRDKANGISGGDGHIILERIHPPAPFALNTVRLAEGSEKALQAYIPGAILQRLSAGQEKWLSELRSVTVLFANLPEIHSETPIDRGQEIMLALQERLYRYEGSVNKVSVDEKGVTLVAALGLHPFAHEDDPERGTFVAMEMLAVLQKMGVRCSIGVTTGRAFCGVIGNVNRREYTMIGGVMNRAARLMKAAAEISPDRPILCDLATFEAAQKKIAYHGRSSIELKGMQDKVPIFIPMHEKNTAEKARFSLIGREKERLMIAERLQALLRQSCSTLIIEGDAGIGKSRLVEDLVRQAETLGLACYQGAGDSVEKTTNYYAWRAIFNDLLQIDPKASSNTNASGLFKIIRPMLKDLQRVPLLNPVLPFSIPENDFTRQMTGQVRANNTLTLLVDILRSAVQEKPGVIVIEDAHWLDSASWALLRAVQRDISPLMLVIVYRPAETMAFTDLEFVRSHSETVTIHLDMLSKETIEALLRQRLGVEHIDPELLRFIHLRAEGHPFFSEEIAYALNEAGLIRMENQSAALSTSSARLENLGFPRTIQGVITSRIDRLSPQEQFTLKVASVIGRVFPYKALYDIHPILEDKPQLHEILSTLDLLDLTPQEAPEPDLSYIFKHIITQEVAYNLMSYSQRRHLHQTLGEYFEHKFKSNLEDFYPLLAHHWSLAENDDKAVTYLDKAGTQALRNFANEEAIQFFEAILKWTGSNPDEYDKKVLARWHRLLGAALQAAGHFEDSRNHLEKAAALIGKPVPRQRQALVPRILVGLLKQVFQRSWRAALPSVDNENKPQDHALYLEMARIYDELAVIFFLSDDILRMAFVDLEMINVADKIGVTSELARTLTTVGVMAGVVGLHRIAEAYHQKAREAGEQLGHLPTKIRIALGTGIYRIGIGHWRIVQDTVREAQETSKLIGDQRQYGEATVILAMNSILTGDLDIGLARYQDLEQHARRINNPIQLAWALDGQGLIQLIRGNFSDAQKLIQQAQESGAENLDHAAVIYNTAYASYAALHLGRPEEAARLADSTIQYLESSMPRVYSMMFGIHWTVETCLTLWAQDKNQENTSRLQRAFRFAVAYQRSFPISQPALLRLQARMDWQNGKFTRAAQRRQQSLQKATELGLPIEIAQTHADLAQTTTGSEQKMHLEAARQGFERLFIQPTGAHAELLSGNNDE